MNRVRDEVMPKLEDEVSGVLPEWSELQECQEGYINVHTLGVMYCAMNDPEYAKLSPQ